MFDATSFTYIVAQTNHSEGRRQRRLCWMHHRISNGATSERSEHHFFTLCSATFLSKRIHRMVWLVQNMYGKIAKRKSETVCFACNRPQRFLASVACSYNEVTDKSHQVVAHFFLLRCNLLFHETNEMYKHGDAKINIRKAKRKINNNSPTTHTHTKHD